MKMILIFVLFFTSIQSSFGQSMYELDIDENAFQIHYQINGDVIAMDIDKEQKSLLVGIKNTFDSFTTIEIPKSMLDAQDNEFIILVDGYAVDYDVVSSENKSKLTFFVPTGTQEIEIIGTFVIPEFSFGVIILLASLVSIIIFYNKSSLKFRL